MDVTSQVLKQLRNKNSPVTPLLPAGMILPNHSGDHSAGFVRETPTDNVDIANKAYVDSISGTSNNFAVGGFLYFTADAPGANNQYWIGRDSGSNLAFNAPAAMAWGINGTQKLSLVTNDFNIVSGVNVQINAPMRWETATAVVAGDYSINRDSDTANQLHFNVPTGKGFEWSIQDSPLMVLSGSTLTPGSNDGLALGTTALMFSDLFLASGAVINWNNGDITLTHSSNTLAFAGASNYQFDGALTFTGEQAFDTTKYQIGWDTSDDRFRINAPAGVGIEIGSGGVATCLITDTSMAFSQGNRSSGNATFWTMTGGTHTNQTASTEESHYVLNFGQTIQFATGALTTQRTFRIAAPTYAFVGASTITTAATFYIDKAPTAGTNATISNSYALWIDAGACRFDDALELTAASAPTADGRIVNESGQNKFYEFSNGIGGWHPKLIFSNFSAVTQSGIVTAASIVPASYKGTNVLPANFFKQGKRVRFIIRGVYTTDAAAGNATIVIKLGSTTWRQMGSFALDNSVTNGYWRMEGAIHCRTTGATGTVNGTTAWEHLQTAGSGNPMHVENATSNADITIDTTASQTIDVQWTADDAGTSITTNDMVMWEEC